MEKDKISIVDYEPKYQEAFKVLNVEWISKYFKMEPADFKALDNPQSYIIDKGGFIFVALKKDVPVGVCAMIKSNYEKYAYELAKMAVSPAVQGEGLGYLLGMKVKEKALEMDSKAIFLESNRKLTPALNLYAKLGFKEIVGHKSPYERSDIAMELIF